MNSVDPEVFCFTS